MRRLAAALLALWVGLASAGAARAHAIPNSMLVLDFGPEAVRVEATLPWAELKYALPGAADRAALETYAPSHLRATTPDGRPFASTVESVETVRSPDHADLVVRYRATPPPGAATAPLVLHFDAVTHVVMSHVVLVLAREGSAEPRLAGVLQNPKTSLLVEPARATGFLAAFGLGARHILAGLDHLLFLLTLLLPAPLLAAHGRWAGTRPPRQALAALAGIVTAFTVGHSLTLLLGATFDLGVPERPVEIAVAASILVAAAGAWRPFLFDGRAAPAVAAAFGLVHGLAFSAAVREHLAAPRGRLEAVAGFNLGIEAVQLLIVLLAAPLLIAAARTPAYRWLRRGGAALTGGAAVVWIAARIY